MSHLKMKAAQHHATMSRAENVVRNILNACNEGELTDDVWDAAANAMSAISHLRQVLWETKEGSE
jgi:plasmid stability protein